MRPLLALIKRPIYGVLGNHDTIRMVPDLEAMGVRMLLNECEPIMRGSAKIYLAGIDDAHYFRVDNIEKAASGISHPAFSILLSHTPEIYRVSRWLPGSGIFFDVDKRKAPRTKWRAEFAA
jgi:hypothetical protein